MSERVLVTDGTARAVVAACRGLGRAGYRPSVTAAHHPAAAQWSRYCKRRFSTPDPRQHPEHFIDRLEQILRDEPHELLLASSDAALLAVSEHRVRIEPHAATGLPPHDAVKRALDKDAVGHGAEAVGLAPPKSVRCDSVDEVPAAVAETGLPAVIKPGRSFEPVAARYSRLVIVRELDEAILAEAAAAVQTPLIVQQFVDGPIVSVGGVVARGRLRALAVSRYFRTWPPAAGNAAASETIEPPSRLGERVESLVQMLGWEGIFEVELVEIGDRLAVLDFNPRPYGSMTLAIRAGANLPAIWADSVLGRDGPYVEARAGMRYRWEDAELFHLAWQLRHGHVRSAVAVLRPRRHVVHAHLELTDPGPFVARMFRLGRVAAGRVRTSSRRAGD
jgi:predicted ATP-grasp superfamily ATP-dependent carboligase